jgi:hypothetical protein
MNQVEAIKYYIEKMDIEMISLILDNKQENLEYDKEEILIMLSNLFDEFNSCGDTELNSLSGRCAKCYKGMIGYTFYGNKSKNYINIIFEQIDGKLNDLTECTLFKRNDPNFPLNTWIDSPF